MAVVPIRSLYMHPMVVLLWDELQKQGDPEEASDMQAYMKTDQKFFGVHTGRRSLKL